MRESRRVLFFSALCVLVLVAWPLFGADGLSPLRVAPTLTLAAEAPLAPDSPGTLTGIGLALDHARAESPSLRVADVAVTLVDSRGVVRPVELLAVSPSRIDFLVPVGAAAGSARIEVRRGDGTVQTAWSDIRPVAPAIEAGERVDDRDDERDDERDDVAPRFFSLAISGVRHAARPVTVTVNGWPVPARVVRGTDGRGVDRLQVGPLPRFSRRADAAAVVVVADGVASNTAQVPLATAVPSGGWGHRAPLLEPNSEMSVAALDGKIYVIGGYPATRISVRTVQVYDPTTDAWSLTTPLPVALNHTVAASVAGRLYVIGGQEEAGGAGPFVDTVYAYDPTTATWTSRARMPTARGGGAAAVVDGRIYVAGGRPPRGSDFAVYDPARDRWTVLPPLPTQRNHLGAAAVGERIFVVGGRFGAGFESERTDAIEIYDTATGTWTVGAPMLRPRGGLNVAKAYGCLHVFGGEGDGASPTGVFPDHDVYDPSTDTWTKMPAMPTPVHGVTGAVFANGLIYLPGGGVSLGGASGSTLHQVYRPAMRCRTLR